MGGADELRDRAVASAEARYGSRLQKFQEQVTERAELLKSSAADAVATAKDRYEKKVWIAESLFEEQEPLPRIRFEESQSRAREAMEQVHRVLEDLVTYVRGCRQQVPPRPVVEGTLSDPEAIIAESGQWLVDCLPRIRSHRLPKFLRGIVPAVIVVSIITLGGTVGWLANLAVGHHQFGEPLNELLTAGTRGALIGAGSSTLLAVIVILFVAIAVNRRLSAELQAAWTHAARAEAAFDLWIKRNAAARREAEARIVVTRDEALAAAHTQYAPVEARASESKERAFAKLKALREKETRSLSEVRERSLREALLVHAAQVADATRQRDEAQAHELARHRSAVETINAHERESIAAMVDRWCAARNQAQADADGLADGTRALRRPWSTLEGDSALAARFAPAIPFGAFVIDGTEIPGCRTPPGELAWRDGAPPRLECAATLCYPHKGGLLIESGAEGRDEALLCLQAAMMRLLTLIPPGKVRFTILDPVGLGQGFAGFMHLADHMEALVGDRIWTETRHIESRLTELTEHMETVIQKYLRDEFPDIESYNIQADEIAEPLRYLVISDFPTGFNEVAVRRLNSIVESGARCGVHVLLLRDVRASLPTGTDLEILRSRLTRVEHKDGIWRCLEPGIEMLPLHLDVPPDPERSMDIVHRVGRAAKATSRVAVPFRMIAPSEAEMWTRTTEKSLAVELGRTGATRLQQLTLGLGTAQHALIAGRTGSGKSTLLHAIITNTALWYSPDEVELWLIDFKKGVEFKTYATHRLPHARAVAVETDREFGLSVLAGLDAEMKRRGESYRTMGVQDLAGYRRVCAQPLPRVLLIVDEFQELFVEDDKLAQDAAMLLDRLVRQGRAFGMHVILGSQTLGGSYALPRTTMGQMGVRIALQCNEADASLILSDDNLAARSLSRPGEAVYNDSGGLLEGNSPFQVCWLEEEDRDRYLELTRSTCAARYPDRPDRLVVFEGNAPAEWREDRLSLVVAADAAHAADRSRPGVRIWLGDAVSMKEPTNVLLRRQSGSNIVIVGQRDEAALGISTAALGSAVLACAAQRGALRVEVIDGIAPDEPDAGRLAEWHARIGLEGSVKPPRGVAGVLAELADLVRHRTSQGLTDEPPVLLLVHGGHRVRDLRRNEDDYSFSSDGTPPTPDKLLALIMRDGPLVGVHAILWVDTVTNLNRLVDRSGMRELDWRVCFQMSNNDSSAIIDSPAASRIGQYRALVASEEHGTMEKFRPFAPMDRSSR